MVPVCGEPQHVLMVCFEGMVDPGWLMHITLSSKTAIQVSG